MLKWSERELCSCLGEEHSGLREQSVQKLSGGSLSTVFKENPEGLQRSEEGGEQEGMGSKRPWAQILQGLVGTLMFILREMGTIFACSFIEG